MTSPKSFRRGIKSKPQLLAFKSEAKEHQPDTQSSTVPCKCINHHSRVRRSLCHEADGEEFALCQMQWQRLKAPHRSVLTMQISRSSCNMTASCSVLMLLVPESTVCHNKKRQKSSLSLLTANLCTHLCVYVVLFFWNLRCCMWRVCVFAFATGSRRQLCTWMICTYYSLLPLLFPQPDELLVLPWDKVNSCILQQGSKHKQKTYCHPNVNGLNIGHLGGEKITQ